jgi:hypothetical protein
MRMKLSALPLAAATLLAVVLPSSASAAPVAQAAATCPGTFQVLHNDRIGTLKLPAGPYVITTSGGLSCNQASTLFTRFLQDWDGVLPGGWKVKGSGFQHGNTSVGFTVKKASTPPNPPPPNGQTCPGHFTLRANDKIGAMSLQKGNWVIQLTKKNGSLDCNEADKQFALFLTKYYKAPLPKPWTMNAADRTFYYGTNGTGFHLIYDGSDTGGGGNTTGTACGGTFRVLHNDTIGKLKVKAGPYVIYTIGSLTCQEASNDFKQALQLGRLPNANWTLDVQTATFMWLKKKGYRVEPANGV